MGNHCLKEHSHDVGFEKPQGDMLTVPLTFHEISLLRESWAIIKPNWNSIMSNVYKR